MKNKGKTRQMLVLTRSGTPDKHLTELRRAKLMNTKLWIALILTTGLLPAFAFGQDGGPFQAREARKRVETERNQETHLQHSAKEFKKRSEGLINGRTGMWKIEAGTSLRNLLEPIRQLQKQSSDTLASSIQEEGGFDSFDLQAQPLELLALHSYQEIFKAQLPSLHDVQTSDPALLEFQKFVQALDDPFAIHYYFRLVPTDMDLEITADRSWANEEKAKREQFNAWLLGGGTAAATFLTRKRWLPRLVQALPLRPNRVRTARGALVTTIPLLLGGAVKGLYELTRPDDYSDDDVASEIRNPWTNDGDINPVNLLLVEYYRLKEQRENQPEIYARCQDSARVLRDYEHEDLVYTLDIYGEESLKNKLSELEDTSKLEAYIDQRESWLAYQLTRLRKTSPQDYQNLVGRLQEILHLSPEQFESPNLFGDSLTQRTSTAIFQFLEACKLEISYKRSLFDENRLKWMGKDLMYMKVDWEQIFESGLLEFLDGELSEG